jgi:HK97 family phage major capsid protein
MNGSSLLSYSVLLRQEQFLLNDSTSGLLALAPAQGTLTGTPTALDMIASAIGSVKALGYTPDGVVMNPADLTAVRLSKDTQGRHIWSSPTRPSAPPR